MTEHEQSGALYEELNKTIDRFYKEFDVGLVSVIGVLELIKHEILKDALEPDEEDPEDED